MSEVPLYSAVWIRITLLQDEFAEGWRDSQVVMESGQFFEGFVESIKF